MRLRQNRAGALQNEPARRASRLLALIGAALLAGCTESGRLVGVYPEEPLPPAPAGEQLPYPSFQSRDKLSDDERGVLTPLEVEKLEENLSRQAVTRPKAMERRIEADPKAQ